MYVDYNKDNCMENDSKDVEILSLSCSTILLITSLFVSVGAHAAS